MEINIPKRLKDLRAEYAYTQHNVADGIAIKRTTYQAYEEGRAEPPIPTLLNLCSFYGKTVEELLGISTSKPNKILDAYYHINPEKQRIVDFILGLNKDQDNGKK